MKKIGLILLLLATVSCGSYTTATIVKDNGRTVYRKMSKTRCAKLRMKAQKRLQKPVRPVNYGIN